MLLYKEYQQSYIENLTARISFLENILCHDLTAYQKRIIIDEINDIRINLQNYTGQNKKEFALEPIAIVLNELNMY